MLLTKTLIIAHRGAAGLVKFDNTLESFEKAISLGVPFIEFDVRKTKDNLFVCYHDDSFGGVKLTELNYNELLELSRQKGFDIPLLENVIKLCQGRIKLDIELKETGYETEVVNVIKRYLDYSEYVIKSFNDTSIKFIKKVDKNIITGILLGKAPPQSLITRLSEIFPEYRIFRTKCDFVSPNYQLLKFGFFWRMKLIKKNIYVWTVNDEELMIELVNKGVYALITDRPDVALKVL